MSNLSMTITDSRVLAKAERVLGKNWETKLAELAITGLRAALGMTADLRQRDVQVRLGVSPRTIQRYMARGEFPNAYQVNSRRVFIPLKDVEAFKNRLLAVN